MLDWQKTSRARLRLAGQIFSYSLSHLTPSYSRKLALASPLLR
jgi:hypothetical protein